MVLLSDYSCKKIPKQQNNNINNIVVYDNIIYIMLLKETNIK